MAPVKNPSASTNKKKNDKQKQQQPTREDSESVPIERELKDLHDYLQTTLSQATKHQQRQQQQQTQQQQLSILNGQKATFASGYDLETLAEDQQYCFPSTSSIQQDQHHQEENPLLLRQLPQQIEEHILPINLLDLAACLTASAASSSEVTAPSEAVATISNTNLSDSVLLQQRLQLIHQFLNLTERAKSSAPPNKNHSNSFTVHEINPSVMDHEVVVNSASLEDVALSEMSDRAQSIQSLHSIETPTPETTPSYDELQHRLETSNRNIQNIQEQQQQLLRLQNAAKQHLSDMEQLRQNAGKLSFGPGSGQQQNGGASTNGDAPDYQSIEQVHTDMATLVGRMKNLTSFIQDQNELSNLLGDDGPEILAEQEALQCKLESLRTQRDEMRSLVGELQDINRNAEKSANDRKELPEEDKIEERNPHQASPAAHERFVPVEYSRVVPIELLQTASSCKQNNTNAVAATSSAVGEDNAEAALLIQQKTADIEAMKSQLKRLKDMMETVNLIESRTARDPKEIGRTPPPPQPSLTREGRSQSSSSSYDRERTPLASSSSRETSITVVDDNSNDAFISRKVRMLNEVTSDLRAQAESLQTERDRIKALKDEIIRRKEQAAAAALLGEDALKRSSLTPTPTPLGRQVQQLLQEDSLEERDQLKMEYETKKKEFELLCQRLNAADSEVAASNKHNNNGAGTPILRNSTRQDIVSEADDEAEEDLLHDTNFSRKYYATSVLPRTVDVTAATSSTQARCTKDSLDLNVSSSNATRVSTAATTTAVNSTHDGAASLEAASLQSGSSHSFSLPPPMASMSSWPPMPPPPLPSSWNPHFYYGLGMPPPPAPPSSHTSLLTAQSYTFPPTSTVAGAPLAPLPSSNECLCSAGTNSTATLGAAATTSASTTGTNAAAQLAADPVLLQQFVQTQQMLINSVCQCNQMLWHQQREIDALNNTIHILQDRLLVLTGPSTADLSFNLRAESVPPSTISGALPNNLFTSINRAQSEQPPAAFLPNVAAVASGAQSRSAFANYQQQQQLYQRQRGLISSGVGVGGGAGPGAYNYNSETQQQNASSTNTSIYATLNNAATQQPPPPPPSHFNNEATPQSPMSANAGGPGPIFMHHHNNSIHQNNANLRTQNHHANNLQQQHQQHHNNLASANTLNNQVPPGNRANNYWDNFRSYSRQNLLSTNSNKSNEEQQQQLQQQQPQQQPQSHEPNPYQTQRATAATLRNLHLYHHQSNATRPPPPQPPPRDFLGNLNWHENDIDLYDNYNILDNDELSAAYAPASASSSSNIRNMNNVNFGNSPHYQRNKVPAKQTCRPAIGLASTLNQNRNGLEQSSSHLTLRNIGDEYVMSQQQQQESQQHFRNSPFTHQDRQQRFNLLPTSSSTSTTARETATNATLNTTRNLRNDFLLRTVDINDDYGDYLHSSLLTATAAIENVAADSYNVNGIVNDDNDDDDDDTTSEEIKRNLLVNALKNDKFTTKFYESIKEDVFRRLESMLLEKENSSSSCTNDGWQQQQQQYSESHQQPSKQFLTQFCNDVGGLGAGAAAAAISGASEGDYNSEQRSRDPLRKLYLNARMGNQQQQQQQDQPRQQHYFPQQLPLPQLELVLYEREENNNADTESNNADNETLALENLIAENEQPEDENEHCNNIAAAGGGGGNIVTGDLNVKAAATTATLNWRQNIISNVRHLEQLPRNSTTNKKRKNQQQRSEREEDTACSLLVATGAGGKYENEMYSTTAPAATSTSNNNSTQTPILTSPNYDLINYIITRIQNQTHTNTIVNDTLLVEIAKLTATAAQNAAAASTTSSKLSLTTPPPNISPKRIYAKIKKMSIPRQRDEFLRWYQIYLETLFVIEVYQQHREGNNTTGLSKLYKGQQQQQSNKKLLQKSNMSSTQKTKNETDVMKTINSNNNNNLNCSKPNIFVEQHQQQHNAAAYNANTTTNLQINDADLAEADQISANTSLNSGASQTNHNHHGLQPEDEEEDEDDHHAFAEHFANAVSQTINKFKQENSAATEVKHELEEFENNENPDEEGATAAAAEVAIAANTVSIADACTLILNETNTNASAIADDETREQELLQLNHNIAAVATANANGVFNMVEEDEIRDSIA